MALEQLNSYKYLNIYINYKKSESRTLNAFF